MIYIESYSTDPYFNLALEEYVFDRLDRTQEYFMLWQNDNTIVVGKYQNTAQEINQKFVDDNEIRVVRRLSGGGAVYHDKGNLNFTFIVDQQKDFDFDFKKFAMPVVDTLKAFGINAEFTGRNDIVIDGKKFSGNSQYVKQNRIMHHGCIMIDSNLINVADALRPKKAKFESKSAKSVRSRVTTINAHSLLPIGVEAFKKTLIRKVLGDKEIEKYEFTEDELREIRKLASEKYSTWEWNYGKSGNYNYHSQHRYSFGSVEASACVKDGIIQNISISGDFFGSGEISDVEEALAGMRIDEKLASHLADKIEIGSYIRGMTPEDMQKLLR